MVTTLKVLIVEDSEDDALLLSRHLKQGGIDVNYTRVAAIKEMEQALESAAWDAVLCDHNMPGFDPYGALGVLNARKLDIPFIIVSGELPEEKLVEFMKAGAHDVVVKRNLARLFPAIHREMKDALARSQQRQTEVLLGEAIESVDHGFAVFNTDDCLILANSQYGGLYPPLAEIIVPGVALENLIREGVARGVYDLNGTDVDDFVRGEVEKHRAASEPCERQLTDGRWLRTTGRRTAYHHVVSVVTDETERKKAEIETAHFAFHDGLTNLPNRLQFDACLDSALKQAHRTGRQVGVMLLDLDKFKYVNDTFGHAIGDGVLRLAAERLKDCIRASDTVARLGGDEFAVIAANVETTEGIAILAQRIVQKLGEPFEIEDKGIFLAGSVGVSAYPRDSENAKELVRKADIALYRAKERSGGTFEFYNLDLDRRVRAKQSLEGALRKALARGEMEMHYQPRLDLRTLKYVAAEALMRWHHPQRGLLLPGEFIPVAEQSGLILQLDEWALREACRQAKSWQMEGAAPLVVSVNVSAMQLRQASWLDKINTILSEVGLAHDMLELEISELGMESSGAEIISTLSRLKALGTRLAIHNFGTGYSSLTNMRELPIDTIKIDRSFVQGADNVWEDTVTCVTVIKWAHALQRQVVAEGVERGTQLAAVAEQGCDQAQGLYFAAPMTSAGLVSFLCESNGTWSDVPAHRAASST